jgi:predicted Na+-dependent transporter
MVRISGGTFRMGSDQHYPEEAPAHLVTVDPFWINPTPVTNAQCRAFVRATGRVTTAEMQNALLVLAVLPVLLKVLPTIWGMIGDGVLATLALSTVVGIAIGHFLGGPDSDDRTVLAFATGTRHPGLALAIAGANCPNRQAEVLAVVACHVIIGLIVSFPYLTWRKRTHSASVA